MKTPRRVWPMRERGLAGANLAEVAIKLVTRAGFGRRQTPEGGVWPAGGAKLVARAGSGRRQTSEGGDSPWTGYAGEVYRYLQECLISYTNYLCEMFML